MLRLITETQTLGWRLKSRLRQQAGQTSSEYVIIAGMIVVAILAILGIFNKELKAAATKIMGKITGAV